MSLAGLALPTLALPDIRPLGRSVRRLVAIGARAAQMAGFAAVLWLLAAGPGLLADHASTVPHATAAFR